MFPYFRKDVRLPVQLQRAMAAEAEAAREARAKVSLPLWLRNRLISAGLKTVLSHTERHLSYRIISSFIRI